MATQYYAPQSTPPPMPPSRPSRGGKFTPTAGERQIIAIASVPGRMVPSSFGPSEVVYDLVDGRSWYVPQVVANYINELRIQSGASIEVTVTGKKKTDVLIVPVQASMADSYRNGTQPAPPPPPPPPPPMQTQPAAPDPRSGEFSSMAKCMSAAMCAAVDAVIESQEYARRKNLGVTFGEESVRAIGLSIYINTCKGGR